MTLLSFFSMAIGWVVVRAAQFRGLLYNFNQFVSHASQPILADNGNNFFSILAGFGDLSDK